MKKSSYSQDICLNFVLSFAMVCTLLAGVNVVAFAADGNDLIVSVHSFYNDASKGGDGEHLFTKDESEMSWLSSLPTWNDDGEAWKAPASSSTSVWRCYNPNSGEHLYVDEGYADYLAGSGWNKEKVAFYSDDEMGTPVYRLWNGLDGVGSHYFTKDAGEVEWLVGQGWIAEDVAFYGVKEESSTVALVPENGFQSDGTVINTDTLDLTFGSDFGVPSSVVWYKDGAVVGVFTGVTLNQGFTSEGLELDPLPNGTYYVTVENTKGEVKTTDPVVVTDKPALAKLTDYTITEDYELNDEDVADNIVYDTESNKLVATVTMNRNDYEGLLGLIPTEVVLSGEATAADLEASAPVADGTFADAETAKEFTDKNAIEAAEADGVYGIYLDNKSNGSRTYKWVVSDLVVPGTGVFDAALTRGESYVLGFMQDGVSDPDDPTTYAIAGFYDAPYVNAPVGIQLASVDVNEDWDLATFTMGIIEMGPSGLQKAEWLGAMNEIGGTLAIYGSEDIEISEENYDDMDEGPAVAINGGMMDALALTNTDYYFMATLTLDEGIYGPEELTFTSEVVEPAEEAAEGLTAVYNPLADDFNPANIVAEVDASFRAAGTLELYRNNSGHAWTALNPVDVSDAEKVADVKVSKGVSSATFKNVVKKLYDDDGTKGANQYAVKFIPNDTTEYKEATTGFAATATVVELPAQFTLAETTYVEGNTGAAVKVYNQFGKEMTADIDDDIAMAVLPGNGVVDGTMKIVEVSAGSDIIPEVTVSADKKLSIASGGTPATAKVGDSYKYTLFNGQTVYATVKAVEVGVITWTVSIV